MARDREFPDEKTQERQQKTLSLRISDVLHDRLERVRDALSVKSGNRVTTSEVAKQLLESADEGRLELIELLQKPIDAFLRIQEKHAQGILLSKAEWTCIAYYIHLGMERANGITSRLAPESFAAVVEGFLAVYKLLPSSKSSNDPYYLGNLGTQGSGQADSVSRAHVVKAAELCLEKISTAKRSYAPVYAGRNLYTVLDSERLANTEALNEALAPYWAALWRLAARGHFKTYGVPIRSPREVGEEHFEEKSYLPSVSESVADGQYSLSFSTLDGTDLSILLVFPGTRRVMYPISRYPMISAFRAMLLGLSTDKELKHWDSEMFFAYTSRNGDDVDVSFRAKDNGITFGFSPEDWSAVRSLFVKAWDMPEVRRTWDKLTREYGEL